MPKSLQFEDDIYVVMMIIAMILSLFLKYYDILRN